MKEEKLNDVAEKLNLDFKDIKRAKRKKVLKTLSYPFIQLGVYIVTIISVIFSTSFLPPYDNFLRPTYPASIGWDGMTFILNPFFWTLQVGNISGSIGFRKKIGLKAGKIIIIVFSNLILAFLSYFLLHKILSTSVSESLAGTGIGVAYGVYSKEDSNPN